MSEESVGHLSVVVLARVNQGRCGLRVVPELGEDGRNLHEVGACPDHGDDLHATFPATRTPASASTSRTGAKRKSDRSRRSLPSVVRMLRECRSRVSQPTGSRGCSESSSHGWMYTMAGWPSARLMCRMARHVSR